MINQEFLSQCTDNQINKGVAWLEVDKEFNIKDMCRFQYFACNAYLTNIRDYCTNPNDIMPIAFANGIGMYAHTKNKIDLRVTDMWAGRVEYYSSLGQYRSVYSKNSNPLRAICEVYILMSMSK